VLGGLVEVINIKLTGFVLARVVWLKTGHSVRGFAFVLGGYV
jgi:hypothetical protein